MFTYYQFIQESVTTLWERLCSPILKSTAKLEERDSLLQVTRGEEEASWSENPSPGGDFVCFLLLVLGAPQPPAARPGAETGTSAVPPSPLAPSLGGRVSW